MIKVDFYDHNSSHPLKFAVIAAKHNGSWVFCKHKQRATYEVPGGHIEAGEDALTAAKRELFEETGAVEFTIKPVCVYSVTAEEPASVPCEETFGMLYCADITKFAPLPDFEMEKILFVKDKSDLPIQWTYPLIQPLLLAKAEAAFLQNR